jgi:hypothetical protein
VPNRPTGQLYWRAGLDGHHLPSNERPRHARYVRRVPSPTDPSMQSVGFSWPQSMVRRPGSRSSARATRSRSRRLRPRKNTSSANTSKRRAHQASPGLHGRPAPVPDESQCTTEHLPAAWPDPMSQHGSQFGVLERLVTQAVDDAVAHRHEIPERDVRREQLAEIAPGIEWSYCGEAVELFPRREVPEPAGCEVGKGDIVGQDVGEGPGQIHHVRWLVERESSHPDSWQMSAERSPIHRSAFRRFRLWRTELSVERPTSDTTRRTYRACRGLSIREEPPPELRTGGRGATHARLRRRPGRASPASRSR